MQDRTQEFLQYIPQTKPFELKGAGEQGMKCFANIATKLLQNIADAISSIQQQKEEFIDQIYKGFVKWQDEREFLIIISQVNQQIDILKSSIEQNKLYSNLTQKVVMNEIIACLFIKLQNLTSNLKNIQVLKNQQINKQSSIRLARESIFKQTIDTQSIPKNVLYKENNSDLKNENILVFQELNQEEIINIQKRVAQLSEMLMFFSLKVQEQQEIGSQILQNARASLQNTDKAQKDLSKTAEITKDNWQIWAKLFLTMTIILWIADYLFS